MTQQKKERKRKSRQCPNCKDKNPNNRDLEFIETKEKKNEYIQEWRCKTCGEIIYKHIPTKISRPLTLLETLLERVDRIEKTLGEYFEKHDLKDYAKKLKEV